MPRWEGDQRAARLGTGVSVFHPRLDVPRTRLTHGRCSTLASRSEDKPSCKRSSLASRFGSDYAAAWDGAARSALRFERTELSLRHSGQDGPRVRGKQSMKAVRGCSATKSATCRQTAGSSVDIQAIRETQMSQPHLSAAVRSEFDQELRPLWPRRQKRMRRRVAQAPSPPTRRESTASATNAGFPREQLAGPESRNGPRSAEAPLIRRPRPRQPSARQQRTELHDALRHENVHPMSQPPPAPPPTYDEKSGGLVQLK
jgi:hypothetical protein